MWGSGMLSVRSPRKIKAPSSPSSVREPVCAIIADVRLDNRVKLLALLGDHLPPDMSDAELILRGYEAWGSAVVDRLLGDFVFVVWDPRAERLTCARDPDGQRVLFYRSNGATIAAASEIQQLLQDPTVPINPNEDRIRSYLLPINIVRNLQG